MKQNCMQEEINSRLNSGNASNHFVQNLLSPACYRGILSLKYMQLYFCPLFCMDVKDGLSC